MSSRRLLTAAALSSARAVSVGVGPLSRRRSGHAYEPSSSLIASCLRRCRRRRRSANAAQPTPSRTFGSGGGGGGSGSGSSGSGNGSSGSGSGSSGSGSSSSGSGNGSTPLLETIRQYLHHLRHHRPTPQDVRLVSAILLRILSGFAMCHAVYEYGFEFVLTEGPSMNPTIRPSGEMILIEKFSHRLTGGLDGGDCGEERRRVGRVRQLEWETTLQSQQRQRHGDGGDGDSDEGGGDDDDETEEEEQQPIWHQPLPLPASHPTNSGWANLLARLTTAVAVGDVVVLNRPFREGTVCKRITALPGDIVVTSRQDGAVGGSSRRANATEAVCRKRAEMLVEDWLEDDDGGRGGGTRGRGRGAKKSHFQHQNQHQQLQVVPDGHVWIEGDNAVDSIDSRSYGPVPASMIIGRVVCRVWPFRGSALMGRGRGQPTVERGRPFGGSIVLPAGFEGERIVSSAGGKG